MNPYAHITRELMATPWAIRPEWLASTMDMIWAYWSGNVDGSQVLEAATPTERTLGAIAVIPLYGVIEQRTSLMSMMFGGTSTERFGARLQELVADPGVSAIVIDVDSPGGTVNGVDELSAAIYRARGSKPILAVANSMAASAAYWVATAADKLLVTPSGEVGSIGVLTVHQDISAMLEREGVRATTISAGKYKTEGSPYAPLEDEAREAIQKRVDAYYAMFVAAVARNRGVGVADVRGGYGEGRVVGAKEALATGMVDGIGTLADAISLAQREVRSRARMRSESEFRQRRLRAMAR